MADDPKQNGPAPLGGSDEEEGRDEVDIHFDRSPSYETYHADGVHGGMTPQANHLAFDLYVERQTHPQLVRHAIEKDGSLGEEVSRGGREGVLREAQCGVVMDWESALRFYNWLTQQIQMAQEAGIIQTEEVKNDDS